MGIAISILVGLVLGVAGCWGFWRYLLWVRPNVSIAPKIAVSKNDQTGRNVYRFKIYNNGGHQVIGITFKAWLCDLIDLPGGKASHSLSTLPIFNTDTTTLSCRRKADRPWGLTPETFFRSEPDFDVESLLANPGKRILVTLRVTDALSGTTVVQQRTFSKHDLQYGTFCLGEGLEIENAGENTLCSNNVMQPIAQKTGSG